MPSLKTAGWTAAITFLGLYLYHENMLPGLKEPRKPAKKV